MNRFYPVHIRFQFRRNIIIIVLLCTLIMPACVSQQMPVDTPQIIAMPQLDGTYTRATPGKALLFPQDLGPHNTFQTEWWYYTGNLSDENGRRFGYQLTFFRRAITPPDQQGKRMSGWATDQVYLAHFTLSDVADEGFYYFERFSRGAAGLAGAEIEPAYRVWLDHWQVIQTADNSYHLTAEDKGITLDLMLKDVKGIVLQGIEGYSQKGPETGNASYYYSQPRLETEGQVVIDGTSHSVIGYSWKDHEFSTSALSAEQTGWNWFSIQLDDNSEIMVFNILREDGIPDPYSSGSVIYPDSSTKLLTFDQFSINAVDSWQSPHSGAVYPSSWDIVIPSEDIQLRVAPLMPDQELNLTFTYWEGAVQVSGINKGDPVSGFGYVELTGYVGSLAGQF